MIYDFDMHIYTSSCGEHKELAKRLIQDAIAEHSHIYSRKATSRWPKAWAGKRVVTPLSARDCENALALLYLNNKFKYPYLEVARTFNVTIGSLKYQIQKHWEVTRPGVPGPWETISKTEQELNAAAFRGDDLTNKEKEFRQKLGEIFDV